MKKFLPKLLAALGMTLALSSCSSLADALNNVLKDINAQYSDASYISEHGSLPDVSSDTKPHSSSPSSTTQAPTNAMEILNLDEVIDNTWKVGDVINLYLSNSSEFRTQYRNGEITMKSSNKRVAALEYDDNFKNPRLYIVTYGAGECWMDLFGRDFSISFPLKVGNAQGSEWINLNNSWEITSTDWHIGDLIYLDIQAGPYEDFKSAYYNGNAHIYISDESVMQIWDPQTLQCVGEGYAEIKLEYYGWYAEFSAKVYGNEEEYYLNVDNYEEIVDFPHAVGDTISLMISAGPTESFYSAYKKGLASVESSDNSICGVKSYNKLSCVGEGKCEVYVSYHNLSVTLPITVGGAGGYFEIYNSYDFGINHLVGDVFPVSMSVDYETFDQAVSEEKASFTSSNYAVAYTDGRNVYCVGAGKCDIYFEYYGKSYTFSVEVIESLSEPDHAKATVEEILYRVNELGENKYTIFEVEGYITRWLEGKTDGTMYGDYYIASEKGGSPEIYVYGTSATHSLVWDGAKGIYTYPSHPKDFLTHPLTAGLSIGDKVVLEVVAFSYAGTPEIVGIVKDTEKFEHETVDRGNYAEEVLGATSISSVYEKCLMGEIEPMKDQFKIVGRYWINYVGAMMDERVPTLGDFDENGNPLSSVNVIASRNMDFIQTLDGKIEYSCPEGYIDEFQNGEFVVGVGYYDKENDRFVLRAMASLLTETPSFTYVAAPTATSDGKVQLSYAHSGSEVISIPKDSLSDTYTSSIFKSNSYGEITSVTAAEDLDVVYINKPINVANTWFGSSGLDLSNKKMIVVGPGCTYIKGILYADNSNVYFTGAAPKIIGSGFICRRTGCNPTINVPHEYYYDYLSIESEQWQMRYTMNLRMATVSYPTKYPLIEKIEADIQPTCTEFGYGTAYIEGYEETIRLVRLPMIDHNRELSYECAATCESGGLRVYTCACGDELTQWIEPLGHDWDENWVCTRCSARRDSDGYGIETITHEDGSLTHANYFDRTPYSTIYVNGDLVTEIATCTSIRTVIIGPGCNYLADMAFYSLTNVTNVIFLGKLPNYIGDNLFYGSGWWDSGRSIYYNPEFVDEESLNSVSSFSKSELFALDQEQIEMYEKDGPSYSFDYLSPKADSEEDGTNI